MITTITLNTLSIYLRFRCKAVWNQWNRCLKLFSNVFICTATNFKTTVLLIALNFKLFRDLIHNESALEVNHEIVMYDYVFPESWNNLNVKVQKS